MDQRQTTFIQSAFLAQRRNPFRFNYQSEIDDELRVAADFTDLEHSYLTAKIISIGGEQ